MDATGTGDAYISGFMHGYLQGLPARECCKLGTTLASFVIQAVGCCSNIPDADTLAEAAKQLA